MISFESLLASMAVKHFLVCIAIVGCCFLVGAIIIHFVFEQFNPKF